MRSLGWCGFCFLGILGNVCFRFVIILPLHAGKILLTISLHGKGHDSLTKQPHYVHSNVKIEDPKELEGPHISSQDIVGSKAPRRKMAEGKNLMKAVAS